MSDPLAMPMTIGGTRVDARSGERFDVLNPATGAVYATVPKGDVANWPVRVPTCKPTRDSTRAASSTE